MEQRTYPGLRDPQALTEYLLDTWDQGDTAAQVMQSDEGMIVQVGQRSGGLFSDTPRSALTLALEPVRGGLRVSLGEQQWYRDGGGQIMVGGLIGFFPFFFTWPLGGGRDEPVDPQLTRQVWESVERYAQQDGAATGATTRLPSQLSAVTGATARLSGIHCPACGAENPAGAERCQECGTYLQARDCPQCGVSNPATANFCMRCGSSLGRASAE
ncbi:MAG: zinc ribbon domain-containing protein [Oscillochloris sp.]|nr:zinc ribbon domain-containing protein [Oscillochloris sp.]